MGGTSFLFKSFSIVETIHGFPFSYISQNHMSLSYFRNKYGFRNNPEFGNNQQLISFCDFLYFLICYIIIKYPDSERSN